MDICSHVIVDAPIMLGDDGSDTELDAATSDDGGDDDLALGATPPSDANDHISVPVVPAKPVANGQAGGSAADSASGRQSSATGASNPKGSTE